MIILYISICIFSTLLALVRLKTYHAFLFFGFAWSYLLTLIVAILFEIPLDVHSDHDSFELRIQLLMLFALAFSGIALGALLTKMPVNNNFEKLKVTYYSETQNVEKLFANIVFLVLLLSELYVMNIGAILGGYSGAEKRGYFYEYFALLYLLIKDRLPAIEIRHFLFAHIVFALLAGERLMALTGIAAFIFSSPPQLITFKRAGIILVFGYVLTLAHGFRTGEYSLNPLGLIVFGEYATQQSSLLYSSVFLLDFALLNSYGLANALLYLIGLDGSQYGTGLADVLANFGVRGGAGLYFSYFVAIFGWPFGVLITLFFSCAIGFAFRRFLYGVISLELRVFLTFSLHAFAYSPVLFIKPILYCLLMRIIYQGYRSILLHTKTK